MQHSIINYIYSLYEIKQDKKYNIITSGDEYLNYNDKYCNYVPTSYILLHKMIKSYPFHSNDHLIDFGCGKGRVVCISAIHGCRKITGIECDDGIFQILYRNVHSLYQRENINLVHDVIENFDIPDDSNRFFFFYPFHIKLFINIMNRIRVSLQKKYRDNILFLAGPPSFYLDYINKQSDLKLIEHIKEHPIHPTNKSMDMEKQELYVYQFI